MKNILCAVLFLFGGVTIAQNKDSISYWVSKNYISCIDSGYSVCRCQGLNDYLIVDLNVIKNEITIVPSIYYSWETLTTTLVPNITNIYKTEYAYGIDSGTTVEVETKRIIIHRKNKSDEFIKINFYPLEKNMESDLRRQIGVINCRPILNYVTKNCNAAKDPILTTDSLKILINKGLISISCSDDFHYDEMSIKKSETEYFMVYEEGKIWAYPITQRNRFQKIDRSHLTECQTFEKRR